MLRPPEFSGSKGANLVTTHEQSQQPKQYSVERRIKTIPTEPRPFQKFEIGVCNGRLLNPAKQFRPSTHIPNRTTTDLTNRSSIAAPPLPVIKPCGETTSGIHKSAAQSPWDLAPKDSWESSIYPGLTARPAASAKTPTAGATMWSRLRLLARLR